VRGYLTVDEFFSIVIWKANRAKGYVWTTLCPQNGPDLPQTIKTLTRGIHKASGDRERLLLLLGKGLRLAMARTLSN
jgi:hypothetical protein